MTALNLARNAYAAAATPTRTSRDSEYDALARVTQRLRSASGFPQLASALHDNRSLWTLLASDVADSGNGLQPELRARIFYLATFTSEHSRKVLAGRADAGVLVEINTAVMRGLRSGGAEP